MEIIVIRIYSLILCSTSKILLVKHEKYNNNNNNTIKIGKKKNQMHICMHCLNCKGNLKY